MGAEKVGVVHQQSLEVFEVLAGDIGLFKGMDLAVRYAKVFALLNLVSRGAGDLF